MSENIKYLAAEIHSGCDSDFEIINHSDSEGENGVGYQRSKTNVESALELLNSDKKKALGGEGQELGTTLQNNKSDKLVLSLSQEQIYMLTNTRTSRSESLETVRKSKSSTFSNTFSMVPIKIQENPGPSQKPHLPQIVLTSFENNPKDRNVRLEVGDQIETPERLFENTLAVSTEPERKNNNESNRSFENGLFRPERTIMTPVKPLDLNKLSTYRVSPFDIDEHRSSDSGLGICQSELDHDNIDQHEYRDSVPNDLRCRICDNVFKDPRTLNCLHSFCLQCLINENFGQDSSIPFWSGPEGINYEWKGNSDTYPTSNSSSNQGSDSPTPLRSDSRSSTSSSKKTEKSSKSTKKTDSVAVSRSDAVEKLKTLICSICKYCTEMPLGGIIQLPQNYILVRKIENYLVSIRENGIASMWCNLCCDAVTATHHCMTCSINLCGFCKEAHERQRSTAHHNINSMLELQKSKKTSKGYSSGLVPNLKCSMHPGFEMKLFCLTCQQIICSDCNVLLHKGHKVDTVRKAFKTYQKLLKESTEKAKPICEYANHSISKLATISKKINEKCDQVQQEVEMHMAAYFEALEVHRNTLLQQIARARESKMQMILEQQFDLEKRSSQAKTVVEFSEELISIGSEAEILSFVNLLVKRFDFCYKYKPLLDSKISDTLHFLPEVRAPSTKAQNNIPMYGIITTQTVEPTYCTLETEGYDQLRVHRKAELVILSRDSDGMPLCHGGLTITAILKYKDSSARSLPFQISDRRDGAYVISFTPDSTGTLVLSITIKNKHIKGSPFTLRAKSLRPHTGTFHCCAFCSSKGSKAATCACDGTMQGFKGCGHGHAGHPGRRHWSCCASVLENSECTTANKLLN